MGIFNNLILRLIIPIVKSLVKAGCCRLLKPRSNVRVRILELPGDVKDVADWLDNRHAVDELKELANGCPDYELSDNGAKLRCMANVETKDVS